jgi:glycosyltransferase involved in cell wall biosynthesis
VTLAQKTPRSVALVHDRLNVRGGGEMLLEELCRLYPQAPLYTLIYDEALFHTSPSSQREVHTSFIDKLPGARRNHRPYIPLMPLAVQLFDLNQYDLILSSSAAFAHGVRLRASQLHISYIHSPMRYAWHQYRQHTTQLGYGAWPIRALLAGLRSWDRRVARRPQHLLANSAWTAELVRQAFGREAPVIHPPVHIERFRPAKQRSDYYLTVARLVPYKRVDLIVEAFNQLGLPLIVAGDGQQRAALERMGGPNVRILSGQNDEQIAELMAAARAFVYAAEEDFGIAAVEAQAAGCPVIAYGRGGLLETVIDGETGLFFTEQSVGAIVDAVRRFEREVHFAAERVQANAQRFSAQIFRERFASFVSEKWAEFSS